MYPKVKVREQEQDDLHIALDHERSSLLSLDAFESLSIHDFNAPVNGSDDDAPASVVRVPKSYITNSTTPLIPVSKGVEKKNDNNNKVVEDSKQNIRASSIPRPRAVLSSPDNDGMIGSRNKTKKAEVLSGLKNHNLCQNRHTQCKVTPRPVAFGSHMNTRRETKEVVDGKTDLRVKKGSFIADQSPRAHPSKGKPHSIRI
ncbi:hypothetical protein F0562_035317 [Nyssa sinensis]|uniref:Uncharacterized protein n=1 Tax=Nyssa sinensis TaxID=561372 RepID=A0A5J5AC26_9ASTE|nr:hypothetical protein F0562_035317 [Nyssa sinensis]